MPAKKRQSPPVARLRPKISAEKLYGFRPPILPDEGELRITAATPTQQVSANLWVTYIRASTATSDEERWHLAFLPGELISTREWISAAPMAMAALAALVGSQGSDPGYYALSLMAQFEERREKKREGYGYGALAKDQNFNALALARMYTDPSSDAAERKLAGLYLIYLLKAFAFDREEIRTHLTHARNEFANGRLPWTLTGGPITVPKARQAWRTHQDQLKSQKRVYGSTRYSWTAYVIEFMLMSEGHWQTIAAMLERDNRDEYLAYRKRLQERTKFIEELTMGKT